MKDFNVPIQSLIDHIKTATDVDPWAKEMAEELLKEQEHIKPNKIGAGWFCGRCEEFLTTNDDKRIKFCWSCGTPVLWEDQ